MYAEMLDGVRDLIGPPPRAFQPADFKYLEVRPHGAMFGGPASTLMRLYNDLGLVMPNGRVVWGHVCQADPDLFKPGLSMRSATLVYSMEPHFDEAVPELESIAGTLFDLGNDPGNDPRERAIANTLADTRPLFISVPIPGHMSGNRAATVTTIVVHRKHLPVNYLRSAFLPVMALPEQSPAVWIVPSRYWPPELRELWCE